MQTPPFSDLVSQLTDNQTPRVWSLLVTVFGELAQGEGAQIESAALSRLALLMGVKPEATRVALHRLRKDGWIESKRIGRASTSSLTDWGRTQSAAASPIIYGQRPIPDQAWLVAFDHSAPTANFDGIWIASNLGITSTNIAPSGAYLTAIGKDDALPDWITSKVCPPDLMDLTQRFRDRLEQLQNAKVTTHNLDCFEVTALRILIVDGWRRIALKNPHLPSHVFPKSWTGIECRKRVAHLLALLEKQDLVTLAKAL